MSFFDRVFRPDKYLKEKFNTLNQRPAFLGMGNRTAYQRQNDQVHPHQPLSIFYQKTDYENLEHRDWQSKHNSHLNKLTQGVANFLLKKVPYPFMYAEVNLDQSTEENDIQDQEETDDRPEAKTPGKTVKDDSGKPKVNATRGFMQDPQRDEFPMPKAGMDISGWSQGAENVTQPQHYTLRRDMMDKYMTLWNERDANRQNMFYILKKALHKGLATQAAAIIRRRIKGKDMFFVFGSNQIVKTSGTSRLIEKITIRWTSWPQHEDTSNKNANKQGEQEFTIGKDCVLFVPFPCEESALGTSFLQSVWDLGIYQQQNRYMASLYLWNGFETDKYYRVPNTLDSSVMEALEDHMKAPMLKPGVIITHPPGANPEFIDKQFQVETTTSNEPAWDIHNEIYNQDSPFPKMFLEGQVETGALGGSAPEVDAQKEQDTMLQWFHIIDPLVKDINETFFDASEDEFVDVCIIPFMDDLLKSDGSGSMGSMEQPTEKPSSSPEEKQDEPIDVRRLKTVKTNAKVNSMTSQGKTYLGNLFAEGWLPQDDGSMEWLSADTIKEFVEKDFSIKEGYFKLDDHPKDDPTKVTPINSHGKFKVLGYDDKNKKDITEFYIFDSEAPDEIQISPMYYSRDITRSDGTIEQKAISLVNAVGTENPRSMGKTKAFRVK